LLNEGFAVVSIEYRLSGEVHFPVQVHEVKAAIRWIRAHAADYCLDASRIVGWGCSAGGYLMAMAGATNGLQEFEGEVGEHLDRSSALAAVIAHYAPSDLATMGVDVDELPAPMMKMGTIDSPESRLLGYVPSTRPREAQYANVARYVSKDTVPMLLMHGDSDTLLPMKQSQRLYDALQKVGADVAFHSVRGANHAGPEFAQPAVIAIVRDFLKRIVA
jgi:acetyl esterase/lipase